MDLFNLENECLFCDGVCTCPKEDHWAVKLHPGSPVLVDKIRDKENVWVVIISNDKFNETVVCFDKHSGRHQDVSWDRLTPLGNYIK